MYAYFESNVAAGGLGPSMRRMTAERSTPEFSQKVFDGLMRSIVPRSGSSRRSAIRIRREIHRQAWRPVRDFHQRQKLVSHNLGKKIDDRTGPRCPSPLALLVTQAAKRVFEPLLSHFQFDSQFDF